MVEVPSLLFQLDELHRRASISSRSAPTICCSSCSPPTAATGASPTASIRCRRRCCGRCSMIVDKARAGRQAGRRCAASSPRKPLDALALIGLGFRSLSMSPSALGPVKAMLLDLDAGKVEALLRPAGREPAAATARIREQAARPSPAAEGLQL